MNLEVIKFLGLNYTLISSCKITFLIYKVSFLKFGKRNKKQ